MADDGKASATIDRRAVLGGLAVSGLAATGLGRPAFGTDAGIVSVRIGNDRPVGPISRLVFGSNELGTMDGGETSAAIDARLGITARRLGGNLMTTYNWVNNFTNAGKDYRHANGEMLTGMLDIDAAARRTPAAVIYEMHERTRAMGAKTLITLPIAGYVAADGNGAVSPAEAAPSRRFVPVGWEIGKQASDPIDVTQANIPHLVARLVAKYGTAKDGGVWGYALDNEPGLWPETHPRIVRKPFTIRALIDRSIQAAKAIKAFDRSAKVFGPASWGATEMVNFQNAADWSEFRQSGSFIGAYLDAFRHASEAAGQRLLDVLDVHWYAYSRRGVLYRSEDVRLAGALVDAPRSLTEAGYREDSWVADALPDSHGEGVELPILPSLKHLIDRHFPGTGLAVTEFNYGGAGQLAAGLALADALGRMASGGVEFASHWGTLPGWLGQAYRLYLARDRDGRGFGDVGFGIDATLPPALSIAASGFAGKPNDVSVVVINKSERDIAIDLSFANGRALALTETLGFDAAHTESGPIVAAAPFRLADGRLVVPGTAARRFRFA
ncbi:MAG: glycoside hydrolase family 44 protein [Ancalomicrobiaceae bacterium]|nr:glycoside hydrolase family 44 protein [Ancalomicrobiaceae bacterium]